MFFVEDLARRRARWTIMRQSVTQIWPLRPYDWRMHCDSSELRRILLAFDIDYRRLGRDTGCNVISATAAR
jgi:hypothetical protein